MSETTSRPRRGANLLAIVSAILARRRAKLSVATFNAVINRIVAPMHKSVFWGDRMLTLDKACGFFGEESFRRCYDAIHGTHIYDAYNSPHTIAWRLNTLVWAARCGLSHEGDLVECGVFKGDMSWVVASVLGQAMAGRMFYLYDSFEGFSPALSSPEDYPDNPGFFEFANKIYRDPAIYETVKARFAGMPNVKIVRGFLPDSLSIAMPERIAFLHVDLNSPAAEIAVLEALFDRVVVGGLIVFDDYGWLHYQRLRDAEDRFMAERGHAILELPTGQGLVVKQKHH